MSQVTAYTTIAAGPGGQAEIERKRSRFLAVVRRVEDEQAARDVITRMRQEHPDARHHCTAFVIGPDAALRRSNDDGEPSGTAGNPMLEVLLGAQVSDVVAVVMRWFGGTLLGAGGLVRAYGDAVGEALTTVGRVERALRMVSQVSLPHAVAGRAEADLRSRGIEVLGTDYAATATVRLATPSWQEAEDAVAAVTAGEGRLERVGTRWVDR